MPRPALTLSLLLAVTLTAGCGRESNAGASPDGQSPAAPEATPSPGTTTPAGGAPIAPGAPASPSTSPLPELDVETLPAVVARVNGEPITRQELIARARGMRAQMTRLGQAPPPQDEQVYRALLDQLIGGRLLLAEAKRLGLMPSEQEVGAELAKIKQRDPEAFQRQLAAQGMTEAAAAAELAPDLAIRKLVATEVTPTVDVSDQAARRFYEGNRERMKRPPQVRVRHILVGVPRGAPAAERQAARAKAAGLLARIKGGEDFGAVASEASDDAGSRQQGGLMPWLSPGDTVPAFEQAAFALEPGQTSDVVESTFGFHLLRLEERKPTTSVSFEEAKPQIVELLTRQQAREMLERRVAALRQKARVEVLF